MGKKIFSFLEKDINNNKGGGRREGLRKV